MFFRVPTSRMYVNRNHERRDPKNLRIAPLLTFRRQRRAARRPWATPRLAGAIFYPPTEKTRLTPRKIEFPLDLFRKLARLHAWPFSRPVRVPSSSRLLLLTKQEEERFFFSLLRHADSICDFILQVNYVGSLNMWHMHAFEITGR